MRPGEVVQIRGIDIDTSGDLREYTPAYHKTEHMDKQRAIPLGPRAQAIVREWLTAYLFCPRTAEALRFSTAVHSAQRNHRWNQNE